MFCEQGLCMCRFGTHWDPNFDQCIVGEVTYDLANQGNHAQAKMEEMHPRAVHAIQEQQDYAVKLKIVFAGCVTAAVTATIGGVMLVRRKFNGVIAEESEYAKLPDSAMIVA